MNIEPFADGLGGRREQFCSKPLRLAWLFFSSGGTEFDKARDSRVPLSQNDKTPCYSESYLHASCFILGQLLWHLSLPCLCQRSKVNGIIISYSYCVTRHPLLHVLMNVFYFFLGKPLAPSTTSRTAYFNQWCSELSFPMFDWMQRRNTYTN